MEYDSTAYQGARQMPQPDSGVETDLATARRCGRMDGAAYVDPKYTLIAVRPKIHSLSTRLKNGMRSLAMSSS